MLEKEIVVIGAGPAGLSASIEASKAGAQVLVVDSNIKPGGQLFKQIHKFFGSSAHKSGTRGINIGKDLVGQARANGVEIWLRSTVIGLFPGNKVGIEKGGDDEKKELVTIRAKKIIIATGASENAVRFKGWTKPGVMGAGAAQTMVNVNHVRPGNKVVMIGSGNVGLIVSYQLMQAGCEVAALVEAAPKIGGYAVHAAKIRRAGVPIYVKHTITEVRGKDRVEEVIISEVNEKFEPIFGTEKSIKADVVAIGAGLKPSIELARLLNCELTFNPVFGGNVPIHNTDMETSNEGIYIAGDATGVEEANTALEEGRIAGISAAQKLGYIDTDTAETNKAEIWKRLKSLRLGPFGEKRLAAKKKILEEYETRMEKTICK
ncbi:MAG: NAD(P)/FAD-dependent oxidoreductase [Clostridium sp.]|uniref:NAD(P)/FAD-dependent oxidoreductase n=1 Tax=Clostridium sp. TaxID=1506 RepID=UPI0025C0548A|nr:NAD(P)/FAD-dependent oxidoreductase [Clostridium sp.]MCH3964445.1 NAD(P)/FAD-dependent oxidoreductase [Clostridium sp.]MCI1715620.1 NAD(P)/FAD-dependent oxidoreductase [Clostridium sp.]MCI1799588.1 NAD(P)/FAD-dependent oxidoreductase [Clostridium sp.]MCI1813804.1 NAD(P)/FAD-dependent oxidoreductase [Clostridium sp.]MCI1870401.1 NAD(P)/FAD-dependent oxidoreductase [Clostridium sp.]